MPNSAEHGYIVGNHSIINRSTGILFGDTRSDNYSNLKVTIDVKLAGDLHKLLI